MSGGLKFVNIVEYYLKNASYFIKLCKLESRFAVDQVWVRMIGIKLQDRKKGPYVLVSSWRISVRGVTGQPTE